MKLERMIGIISILLQKGSVTASYLAERFEVSQRTILRDIDSLSLAGIPVVTRQGTNGGISILDNYKITQTLLTSGEMQDILAGLRSLDSVNGTNHYKRLMDKLSAGSSDFLVGSQSVLIDLSSWYKETLASKIQLIRTAMDSCHLIAFSYYAPAGESERIIEPYFLVFRWSSWYVWGWCKKREDYRMFKLNRMEHLQISEYGFARRQVPMPDISNEKIFPGGIKVKALFDPECKWRLVEEFGSKSFIEREDGKLLFQADYTDKENLISWLMTFRDRVELLEPEEIRQEIRRSIEQMKKKYGG